MKILVVEHHNDYEALDFEQTFHGQNVSDLIKRVEVGEILKGEGGDLPIKIYEIPEQSLSQELVKLIRNEIQDYDHSKHCNFYLEETKVAQ